MIRAFTNWLSGRDAELQRLEAEVHRLTAVCDDAFQTWQADKKRGDTRAEHVSYAAFQHARHEAMRAELALSALLRSSSEGACSPQRPTRGLVPAGWTGR